MLPPRVVKTGAYALTVEDRFIGGDASGGAFDLTLPDAPAGWSVWLDKDDASANAVTIKPPAGGSINGAASEALASRYDTIQVVCLGSKVYRVVSRTASGENEKTYDITKVAEIADGYNYVPGFTPKLVLLFHADAGNVMGLGWAVGTGAAEQGAFFRDTTSSLTKQIAGKVAVYAAGSHSQYAVTAFGATVTVTRTLVNENLKNVVLIAFK